MNILTRVIQTWTWISSDQSCGSGMFIPDDSNFSITDPGSETFRTRIRSKEFKYF
jgi:hypothetical protein